MEQRFAVNYEFSKIDSKRETYSLQRNKRTKISAATGVRSCVRRMECNCDRNDETNRLNSQRTTLLSRECVFKTVCLGTPGQVGSSDV